MATATAPIHPTGSLLERTFVINTAVQALGYASYAMVLPVLPLYLVLRGEGETFVGLLIAAFNVTSFLCRPWIGMQVDGGNLRSTLLNSCLSLGITPFLFLMPSY